MYFNNITLCAIATKAIVQKINLNIYLSSGFLWRGRGGGFSFFEKKSLPRIL